MKTRIKLCGVRRASDAVLCAEAGADEIGVIFARTSRRRIEFSEAREIRAALPPAVGLVGVFLDATADELEAAAREVPLSALQLHGRVADRLPKLPIYLALHVSGPESLERIREVPIAARVLLDSPKGGGSGASFPWDLALRARDYKPRQLFLAGWLTADNVAAAIRAARPDGVDVASGIEGPDGFKDPARVRAFVKAVRDVEE